MKKVQISINPTYKCNYDCSFCYLKHNNKIMDLTLLEELLKNISKSYKIDSIDVFGGEICLLPDDYLMRLILICKNYVDIISVITNLSIDKQWLFERNDIDLSVSWDDEYRKNGDETLKKLEKLNKKVGIILTSPKLYEKKYDIVKKLNQLKNEYFIDIKPCMPTKENGVQLDIRGYQDFVKFMVCNLNKNFTSINLMNVKDSPKNNKISHIFINPNCQMEKLTYDNGYEEFKIIDKIEKPIKCLSCDNIKNCLAEHDSYITDSFDCIGMKKLYKSLNSLKKYEIYNWRKRRILSYIINKNNFGDKNLSYFHIPQDNDSLYKLIIKFFKEESELIYPAKSYYVAIVYAWLLNKYFGEDIKVALNYNDLLNYDDKFFITYDNNKELYDRILVEVLDKLDSGEYDNSIKSTLSYFKKEFLIDD